ncbi:MAG: IPT/TIG domain-containing protein [Treponema sp.]|nr:IPT/TIG domain-containing protein [Treponema sp.]
MRWITGIIVLALVVCAVFLFTLKTKVVPEIYSIVPPVGSPGDLVSINGKNFGNERDMSYVEIAGTKLTASSYISWSDTCIRFVLPDSVQDGLVIVGTRESRSAPALFANETDIPVPVVNNDALSATKPVITYLSAEKVSVGDVLVIQGDNFGDTRNQSKVYFTVNYNNKIDSSDLTNIALLSENMVSAREDDYDYVSWSNTEIKVHVPDGAHSGVVIVDNRKEKSEAKLITVNQDAGIKKYLNKKIYLLQYSADIADVMVSDISSITLRCPLPYINPSQPSYELTEVTPAPILMNYQNNLIHQVTKNKSYTPKTVFSQTFVLPVYEVQTEVKAEKLSGKTSERNMYSIAMRSDALVPSDDEDVVALAAQIVGKEKNVYRKARLIYDYMCDNFQIQEKLRKNDAPVLDLLKYKKGDAYDFAVIYTALLRAAGIPAMTNAGILVCQDLMTQSHWWSEFYVEKIGWIPVDPAIGAGLKYRKWSEGGILDERNYYFGNLDSHHITFSHGWNQLKPFSLDNKIVQQPRSFALQSIWEEASESTVKYSSYWSIPVVKGVY